MAVSLEFLRGALGVIGVACAYMAGRSLIAVRKGWQKLSSLYGWILRGSVCLLAIIFRHPVDNTAIVLWVLAAICFGAGMYQALHRKPPEDLTHQIFPE